MAVNDIYECTISGSVRGEHCETTIHLREVDEDLDPIPAANVCEAVSNVWATELAPLLAATGVILQCVYARRVKPTPGIAFTQLIGLEGEVVSEAIPANSGLVLSWVTDTASRSGRGRNWIYGYPETQQNGGNITSPGEIAFAAFIATVMGAWGPAGTGDYRLVVYSPTTNTAANVLAGVVRTNLGVMRSRRTRPGIAT